MFWFFSVVWLFVLSNVSISHVSGKMPGENPTKDIYSSFDNIKTYIGFVCLTVCSSSIIAWSCNSSCILFGAPLTNPASSADIGYILQQRVSILATGGVWKSYSLA
jgi:hypothetical protein